MIDTMLSSPLFGLVLTCIAWCIGCWVQKRMRRQGKITAESSSLVLM